MLQDDVMGMIQMEIVESELEDAEKMIRCEK